MPFRALRKTLLFLGVILYISMKSHAENSTALWETQNLLRDPTQRKKAIQNDSRAQDTDQKVNQLANSPETSQKVYDLSADVFKEIHAQTGDDGEKMKKLLNEAAQNPEGFANSLSPEAKEKLRTIASEIESNQKQRP